MGGEEAEEGDAEFVKEVKGDPHGDHGGWVAWRDEGGDDGAGEEGVLAILLEGFDVDESCPAQEENDDGELESQGEGEGEHEEEADVLGDAVLLDDADLVGKGDGVDLGFAIRGGGGNSEGGEGAIDPLLAGLWVGGVGVEDGDGGEDDAWRERGGCGVACAHVGAEGHEEGHGEGEDDLEEEEDAQGGERGGEGDEEVDVSAFVMVESRGDEEPELEEEPRAADDDGGDEADVEVGEEEFEWAGGLEGAWEVVLTKGFLGRGEEEGEEFLAEDHREDEDGDEAEDGDHETTAEFVEVLAEGHGVGAFWGGHVREVGVR